MISLIGLIICIVGFFNAAWVLLFYILNASSQVGANISKKIGTDNENTEMNLKKSKEFSGELKTKLITRLAVGLGGLLLYYFFK